LARREGHYGVGGLECRIIWDREGDRVPVLFLHGYSFTGQTWDETGVLDALSSRGDPWAAPDMPYGRRTACTKHTRSVDLNVAAAKTVVDTFLDGKPPVVVGASLGGRIAIHYASRHGAAGLFLLAPALRQDDPAWEAARLVKAPTVIVAGTNDKIVPLQTLEELARTLKADLLVYEGAGHAMYLEQPERFRRDLEEFLDRIEASRPGLL